MPWDVWAEPYDATWRVGEAAVPVQVGRLSVGQRLKLTRVVTTIAAHARGIIADDLGGSWEEADKFSEALRDIARRFVRLPSPVTVLGHTFASVEDVLATEDPDLIGSLMWLVHGLNRLSEATAKNSSSPPDSAPGSGDSQPGASGDVPAPTVAAVAPTDSPASEAATAT